MTAAQAYQEYDALELISREDLRRKLDGGEDLKLVCALGEWAYRALHIPGSIHVDGPEKADTLLDRDDQIVVYCTNVNCPASIMLYNLLTQHGYRHVKRYAGGLEDWEEAGYSLVGEKAPQPE
jgi:rhodanese-related sulfurtransferase